MLTSSIASCMARHVQEALATQRKSPTELSTCVSVSMGSEVSDSSEWVCIFLRVEFRAP